MFKKATLLLVVLVSIGWAGNAWAGFVILTLQRVGAVNTINGVQTEGGNILKNNVKVGQYAIQRIQVLGVINGGTSSPLNTAMTTITLFFALSSAVGAPENVTLQGSHDFTSNAFKGSVSAASNFYSWIKGADASYSALSTTSINKTLVVIWNGANQLTLP